MIKRYLANSNPIMARMEKRKGLRRPQRPVNFQISSADSGNSSKQSSTLRKQILILDLIIRRGKNQHRSQLFFKHAQILRHALRQLLSVYDQLDKLSAASISKSAEEVRRRFEQEANLRGQREMVEQHIRDVLVPKCYVSFSTVVADLPFANLGVVLVALLAEIAAGKDGIGVPAPIDDLEEVHTKQSRKTSGEAQHRDEISETDRTSVVGLSTRMTGEDHGEVIERRYEHSHAGDKSQNQLSMIVDKNQNIDSDLDSTVSTKTGGGHTKHVQTSNLNASPSGLGAQEQRDTSVVKQKRNKKKKNALDDLFSKLL